jgi:AraC-like DNA-binding protein
MSLGGAFRVFLSALSAVGLDPEAVCAEAGVDPRVLTDEAAPLGLQQLHRVLAQAETRSGDPLLGLHMAERAPGRGVLAYLARAQRTVGEGLTAFERFAGATWGTGTAVHLQRRGGTAAVVFALRDMLPRHAVEYLVARTAISLRRSGVRLREIALRHRAAGDVREYERVLRCPVRFARPEHAVSFPAADLERPLRTASAPAATALAAALSRVPTRRWGSTLARLATAIEDALARGERLDREVLARSVGMSGKTLARRLAAEQRRFRDVVDEVRRALAQRLVEEGALDLTEVAARVGFADLAAFGKAFRRWFGESPSAYRARRRRAP